MDPITLALMGGSTIASLIGGAETNRINKQNADISLMNFYEQQAASRRAANEARRQQGEQKLGTTDAQGNRTHFVPGVGWVTDLSADQQELQDLTTAESKRVLTDEAGREAERSELARDRRGRENTLATEGERELRAVRRPDEGALRQLLLARGAEQRNASADRAGNLSARAATRSGQGGSAADIRQGARAEADADSARQAGIQAELQARNIAGQEFAQERDAGRNIYDYFRRASTSGTAPVSGVTPTGPNTRGTAGADQSLAIALSKAPQLDYQSPNHALSGTGQDLINMIGQYRGLNMTNQEANRVAGNQGTWQGIVN